MALPRPAARAAALGRPATDPGCAGCAHLVTLRALRRAGVEVQGGLGCEEGEARAFVPSYGRWGAVTGVARLLREGAPALLAEASRTGAGLLVIADRVAPVRSLRIEEELARAGARHAWMDLEDAAKAEALVREVLDGPGRVIVALARCVRGVPRVPPLAVDASLCNRCGSCLTLACPALSDGEEATVVDPAVCTGCGRCAPLCRSRALGAPRPV
jgi:TPP-dependent indolepyruvate ferredoxin oxidoreductase alpha subunit